MKRSDAITTVCKILHEKFDCSDNIPEGFYDTPLTGGEFKFTSVQMLVLFFEIEKILNVRIKSDCLRDYGFSTINKISDVISSAV